LRTEFTRIETGVATSRSSCAGCRSFCSGSANQRAAESLYIEASQRFVKLTNDFLDRLAASGDRALVRARERRAAGAEAVHTELSRIQRLDREIEALVPLQRKEPIP
jgi:hypothetical protein